MADFVIAIDSNGQLEKAIDRSKLAPKQIIDKNRHKKTVYVRMELTVKKPAEGRKEGGREGECSCAA
ncbi:MAG: hypothetical protein LBQ69_04495 [Treponema sp.]|jgi:hypothetical protein|nr:hypothetical protein [Treponema sp.]